MGRTVLKGTPVCGGVAMGVVRYLDVDYDSFIKEYKKTDKDGELARFVLALKNAKADLDEILSEGEKLSSEEEDIIEMHLMLLDDAGFIEAIKRGIKEGLSCPTSIRKAVADLKNMFAAMDDEYLRDRANDVEDVGNRVLRKLLGMPETKVEGENLVIVAKDVEPALMAGFSEGKVKAVILENGSKTSHSVIIAKAKGFVTLVGVDISKASGSDGCVALVDGKEGSVVISPEKGEEDAFTKKCEEYRKEAGYLAERAGDPAVSLDGGRIKVAANVASPDEMDKAEKMGCEGVGLYRTEFLFMDSDVLPDEEKQTAAYRELLEKAGGNLCIIRTLDIGGDKKCRCLDIMPEENPFLGYRAIRICLDKKEMFKTQLRSLVRASAFGKLGIMIPMIDTVAEIKEAKALFEVAKSELRDEGVPFDEEVLFGIMTETPASVMMAADFAKYVDFFSIGTNDLVQYTMAVDRGNGLVAYLYDYFDPAVVRAVYAIAKAGRDAGIMVGMCGEMAGDALAAPLLMAMGLDELSMSPSVAPEVKEAIRTCRSDDVDLEKVLSFETAEEVRGYLEGLLNKSTC